jgi:hypothetical protein
MDDVTGYFITTDRVHAPEALESLRSQEILRSVMVSRNVRPYRAAVLPTLNCKTPYSLVLDDDTVLRPGAARQLVTRFREMRAVRPRGFKLSARVYDEVYRCWEKGGVMLFYTPHLREIGWPDAPHVAFAQHVIARNKGFEAFACEIEAGVQKRGTNLDVYKKFFWDQIRAQAGQLRADSLDVVAKRARDGTPWMWFGVLGVVDGMALKGIRTSKDDQFLGPIARKLDFATIKGGEVRRVLMKHGIKQAVN